MYFDRSEHGSALLYPYTQRIHLIYSVLTKSLETQLIVSETISSSLPGSGRENQRLGAWEWERKLEARCLGVRDKSS